MLNTLNIVVNINNFGLASYEVITEFDIIIQSILGNCAKIPKTNFLRESII